MERWIALRPLLLLLIIPTQIVFSAEKGPAPVPSAYLQCSVCHGVGLGGNFATRAPRISGLPGWYVANQLESFKRAYRGWHEKDISGLEMQPMAANLTDKEIGQSAEYVSQLSSPPSREIFTADPQGKLTGDPKRGRKLYQTCSSCHGAVGEGNAALEAPPLTVQNNWYLVKQLRNFRDGLRGGIAGDIRGAQMLAAMAALSDEQSLVDVVAYITSMSKTDNLTHNSTPHSTR